MGPTPHVLNLRYRRMRATVYFETDVVLRRFRLIPVARVTSSPPQLLQGCGLTFQCRISYEGLFLPGCQRGPLRVCSCKLKLTTASGLTALLSSMKSPSGYPLLANGRFQQMGSFAF